MVSDGGPHILLPHLDAADCESVRGELGPSAEHLIGFEDVDRIGPDNAYTKLWNACSGDVVLWHTDMRPVDRESWFRELLGWAERLPQAGILGCKLLYPVKRDGHWVVQSAGGYLTDRYLPVHYGGGMDLFGSSSRGDSPGPGAEDAGPPKHDGEAAVLDDGRFEEPRRVTWVTFGGCYIRREVLDAVGGFDPDYRFSYYSDADYCMRAAEAGFEIWYVPVPIFHDEGRDNKRRADIESIREGNKRVFKKKWRPNPLVRAVRKLFSNSTP